MLRLLARLYVDLQSRVKTCNMNSSVGLKRSPKAMSGVAKHLNPEKDALNKTGISMPYVQTPFSKVIKGTGGIPVPNRLDSKEAHIDAVQVARLVAALDARACEPDALLASLREIRQLLAVTSHPPIEQVISLGGVGHLVNLLAEGSPAIQTEAAWALANIATGTSEQTRVIVELGGVDGLFKVVQSPSVAERYELCDQCLWILGNIAGDDDVSLRDHLLQEGVVNVLGHLYSRMPMFTWGRQERMQVLQTLTWLMCALCHGSPAPPLDELDCAFDYFVQVILGTDDSQMISEALFGLCYLVEGAGVEHNDGNARIARLLSAGFGPEPALQPPVPHPLVAQVVHCIGQPTPTLLPAVRLLGAMVSSSNKDFTDSVLAAGGLKAFHQALVDKNIPVKVQKDVAWILSNISAGTSKQAQQLIAEPKLWDVISGLVESATISEVRHECAWVLANVANGGSSTISRLDSKKVLHLVVAALRKERDPKLQRALLDAGEAALKNGEKQAITKGVARSTITAAAEACGFLQQLEELQHSESENVYRKAVHVLESWFEADGENAPPQAQSTVHSDAIIGTPMRYQFGA